MVKRMSVGVSWVSYVSNSSQAGESRRVGGLDGWVGVLTVTYLNGFSPVCVRMWLLSVVAPANARPQYPHLKGRSLECVTTWFLKSDG